MNWQEVLKSNHEVVIVKSYGYTERGLLASHFEPFRSLREFTFLIDRIRKKLTHKWLKLEESEKDLQFEEKDGKLYVFDPDLWAKTE